MVGALGTPEQPGSSSPDDALVRYLMDQLEGLPSGPDRSLRARELVLVILEHGSAAEVAELYLLNRLLVIADECRSDDPSWRRTRATARCFAVMAAAARHEVGNGLAMRAQLAELTDEFPNDPALEALVAGAEAVLDAAAGNASADIFTEVINKAVAASGRDAATDPLLALMSDYARAMRLIESGDHRSALDLLVDLIERAPFVEGAESLAQALDEIRPAIEQLRGASPEHNGSASARHDLPDEARALQLTASATAALDPSADADVARVERAIDDLRLAAELTIGSGSQHVFQLASLGLAYIRLWEVDRRPAAMELAATQLSLARDEAHDASDPQWSFVCEMLAQLHRYQGDLGRARLVALEGIRGYAWRVMSEPDLQVARTIAFEAAEQARQIASDCLTENAAEDALRAMDAGRGLILFAATELRDPAARLRASGRPDLAALWQSSAVRPTWLRREVLQVLTSRPGLLDAPDLAETQAALTALETDALVYLLPASDGVLGCAFTVPAVGPVEYIALPELAVDGVPELGRYFDTLDRPTEPATEPREVHAQSSRLDVATDAVCDWAWRVAMKHVLGRFPDDRLPRLVLVPMGDLARIPWQAARDPAGRRVVERAVVSQAVSARMICQAARSRWVAPARSGLIVGDPETDHPALPSARLEAYAIRECFYPNATYLGRLPRGSQSGSGAGTAAEILAWLAAPSAERGSMLHLATHAEMLDSTDRSVSRLILADGELDATELIAALAAGPADRLGLVVLAACHTGNSAYGYDEAFSLATAFLAMGATAVLSTQWAVPDVHTSVLMFMFHHYLSTDRSWPADALRRAQLWMLNRDRVIPDSMPSPMRTGLLNSDPAQLSSWAGFVSWGQ